MFLMHYFPTLKCEVHRLVSESHVLSYLLHGGPSLSERSGETVRERAALPTDVGLNLHSYRVAKPQGVGGLKRKIPADKTSGGRARVRVRLRLRAISDSSLVRPVSQKDWTTIILILPTHKTSTKSKRE